MNLKEIRKEYDLSQQMIARAAGLTKAMIHLYEQKGARPELDTAYKVQKAIQALTGKKYDLKEIFDL